MVCFTKGPTGGDFDALADERVMGDVDFFPNTDTL